jgi:hypothetical protein
MPFEVTPKNICLRARETQAFQVAGSADAVVWSIVPQTGRIDAQGVYTAPLLSPRQTRITVKAQEGARFDTAEITLNPGWFWLHFLGMYWLAWVVLLLHVVLFHWVDLCPNCRPSEPSVSPPPASLIALIALAGALGGLIHGASSFAIFAGNREFQSSWTWWYVLRPLLGGAVAVVVCLVVRSGLGTPELALSGADCLKTAGIAGLVGMFAEPAMLKLKDIFNTLFTPREDARKDALADGKK